MEHGDGGGREEHTNTEGWRYRSELTVEVEVEGMEKITTMDILREVKTQCGEVVGCRVKGERVYEITMKEQDGKNTILDGIRIRNTILHTKEITSDDVVVSFLNLPVYIQDSVIINKLKDWGVTPMSQIKRRKWPGTDIADGTRFLKVRFNDQVRSLPYSTKFETLRGTEYVRVIHDRQVKVCRLCIKPGHIFRECPEFKCYRCQKTGHYARECQERAETERAEGEENERADGNEVKGGERQEERESESGSEAEERDGDGEENDEDGKPTQQDEAQDGEESAMEEQNGEATEEGQQKEGERKKEPVKKTNGKSKKTPGGGGGDRGKEAGLREGDGGEGFIYEDITD